MQKFIWFGLVGFVWVLVGLGRLVLADDGSFVRVVIPIYAQKVSFHLPVGWRAGYKVEDESSYLIEFIPEGEEIERWTNLISLRGYRGASGQVALEGYFDGTVGNYEKVCPGKVVYEKLGASSIDGFETYSVILGCGELLQSHASGVQVGQSEVAFQMMIAGQADIYLLQKAVRGAVFAVDASPINRGSLAAFVGGVWPVALCSTKGAVTDCLK